MATQRTYLHAAIPFALGLAFSCAVAQSTEPQSPPNSESVATPDSGPTWLEVVPVELQDPTKAAVELCHDKPGQPGWLSHMRAGIYRTLCTSAAWFDGFFGNARFDDEYQATRGSVTVGAAWDERDHWDPSMRFRVHLRLPQLSERFDAFVGRVDPEEYVTELRDDFDTLPRQFAREQDDATLLGLGYQQPGPGGGRFNAGVGARTAWPLEPYAKGTYRYTRPFLGRNVLHLHETVFWNQQEHFGVTTRVDLERILEASLLVRWTTSGTLTERTEGVRWFSNLTLYHSLGNGRAFAYQSGVSGVSDHEVGIVDYGVRIIYRRRILYEWLFVELRSGISWPRESLLERRESNLGAGAAIELTFGERRRR